MGFAAFWYTSKKNSHLFKKNCKIGFNPNFLLSIVQFLTSCIKRR